MSPLINALREPEFWPGEARHVDIIETHISWVFLVGEFAWKIKKPVRFDFLDFSTLTQRKRLCETELELNRRTAADLYLRVVPITGSPDAPQLDGDGAPVEFAIQMRRFDQDQLFLHLARARKLTQADIDALAGVVAGFHLSLPPSTPDSPWGGIDQICAAADGNFNALLNDELPKDIGERDRIEGLASWTNSEQERLSEWFCERKRNGFVRECHGDLHLRNIVRYQGKPCLFDCIEFNPSFRWIDIVNDLAFLVSDLEDHALEAFGWRLLDRWLEATGDFAGVTGLRFYLVYRAMVRAKVNVLRLRGGDLSPDAQQALVQEFRGYLDYSERIALPAAHALIIMHGLSGSGKTTVSGQLIESIGAIRIRSDVERKRLAGLLPSPARASGNPSPPPDLYSGSFTSCTYEHLAQLAGEILSAGFTVIVDAAFLRRNWRRRFAELASHHGVPFRIVSCAAPEEVLRDRLTERSEKASDLSDADVSVLQLQLRHCEPLTEEEESATFHPGTDQPLRDVSDWGSAPP